MTCPFIADRFASSNVIKLSTARVNVSFSPYAAASATASSARVIVSFSTGGVAWKGSGAPSPAPRDRWPSAVIHRLLQPPVLIGCSAVVALPQGYR